jgi:hypothetical protein
MISRCLLFLFACIHKNSDDPTTTTTTTYEVFFIAEQKRALLPTRRAHAHFAAQPYSCANRYLMGQSSDPPCDSLSPRASSLRLSIQFFVALFSC